MVPEKDTCCRYQGLVTQERYEMLVMLAQSKVKAAREAVLREVKLVLQAFHCFVSKFDVSTNRSTSGGTRQTHFLTGFVSVWQTSSKLVLHFWKRQVKKLVLQVWGRQVKKLVLHCGDAMVAWGIGRLRALFLKVVHRPSG
jgi:hypothetical protein